MYLYMQADTWRNKKNVIYYYLFNYLLLFIINTSTTDE